MTNYDTIAQLLTTPSPETFEDEFNRAAIGLEETRDENLPAPEGVLSWIAENGRIYSPPIQRGKIAVRISIPVRNFQTGNHLAVRVHPLDDQGNPLNSHDACITATAGSSLLAIFATWDYVARVGPARAVTDGIVTAEWVDRIFESGKKACSELTVKPAIPRYGGKCTGKVNVFLTELEALLAARNMGHMELKGETSRDNGGRIYSTWFSGDVCTCCDQHIRPPSRAWPYSQYKHVMSIRHKKNAALALLRQIGQGNGAK